MAYRRRRHRRRPGEAGAFKIIAVLVVAAGIIYFISASKAGTWLAEEVIAPVVAMIDSALLGNKDKGGADPAGDQGGLVLNPEDKSKQVTRQLSLGGLDAYLLQMGVFSTRENAQVEAENIKSRGAAGYILEDDEGRFRVMASSYEDEASLKSVRQNLKDEGIDSASHVLSAVGADFNVTATENQLVALEQVFGALKKCVLALNSLAIEFDKESLDVAEGKDKVNAIKEDLESAYETLKTIPETGILTDMKACYSACLSELELLSESETTSFIKYASMIKHAQVLATHEYYKLLKKAQ